MTEVLATKANMTAVQDLPDVIALGLNYGEVSSANPADYWFLDTDDEPLTDSEGLPMILVQRTVTTQDVILPGQQDTYATSQIDRVVQHETTANETKNGAEETAYELQILSRHTTERTKYLSITPEELAAIREILSRRTVDQ